MAERTGSDFNWQSDSESTRHVPDTHKYPPDQLFDTYLPFSFTTTFIVLAILATAVSIARVGMPETGIPYNYPVYAGLVYVIAVLFVLRRFHSIFDATKQELVDILDRTTADSVIFTRDSDITPREMEQEVNNIMDKAFDPVVILAGGFIGGIFSLAIMWALNVFDSYPYLLLNYAYGAGHGFFYGPIAGSVYLIHKISNEYIVDIDIFDPDGVGGYREIGDAIISIITHGIFLITLDFVILSSVSFIGRPVFQTAVFVLYGLMLVFLLVLTVYGVMSLRKRLLAVRQAKTDVMREKFTEIETRYWQKLEQHESPKPEAEYIETMDTMFKRMHSMELWPINLAAFARLAFSTGSSAAIAAYKAGYIPIPI